MGNETLQMKTLSESELISYIRRVKQAVPRNVRVTTAEAWSIWLNTPSLVHEVDYVLVHIHPFWEGQPIQGAASWVVQRYDEVKAKLAGKEVIIGETGWPSRGTPEDACVPPNVIPSEENQRKFIQEFAQLAREDHISYYLFSTYDEEWKWKEGCGSQDVGVSSLPLDRNLSGRFPGSSWGIFYSDGRIKSKLANLFQRAEAATSRTTRVIFDGRGLHVLYDVGADSLNGKRDWLATTEEAMRMAYPPGQSWGAVFITVGVPVDPPRPWKDFSQFRILSIDLKGEVGGESLEIGIKDASDPDTGAETKKVVSNLSTGWQTFEFPLHSFSSADLRQLYVVAEFVFTGPEGKTVYFKNVRYLP